MKYFHKYALWVFMIFALVSGCKKNTNIDSCVKDNKLDSRFYNSDIQYLQDLLKKDCPKIYLKFRGKSFDDGLFEIGVFRNSPSNYSYVVITYPESMGNFRYAQKRYMSNNDFKFNYSYMSLILFGEWDKKKYKSFKKRMVNIFQNLENDYPIDSIGYEPRFYLEIIDRDKVDKFITDDDVTKEIVDFFNKGNTSFYFPFFDEAVN